jgi:hypothetical protein
MAYALERFRGGH